ncbi:MAG: nucleotidyltransferase domain-containing protein [Campylobacterota bacterium]|nr:nucleotidyltransferase domain-containing protein [Campylobacterota bacterium]
MDQNSLSTIIQEFEEQYGYRIVYITQYGSKLYGTDNPNSDRDYKGIFIPSRRDLLLKRDIEHYNHNSNSSNTKNSKEDIDLQLYSIYKWFALLKKGETGALDILFSLYREDTQIVNDREFTQMMMQNHHRFYNRNLHSFIGYCVGQSKMYNVKGERYKELLSFVTEFSPLVQDLGVQKLQTLFPQVQALFDAHRYKYIRFITAATSRGNDSYREGEYIEVLGKRFSEMVTIGYFVEKITTMQEQFGNRSKASATGVDFKALSHAVRVISEVEELLDDNFITFPLPNASYVKSIKDGHESLEDVMEYIDKKLTIVQEKLKSSDLPEKSDEQFMDGVLLGFYL